jgi:type 1 glutamine amidotransferase
MKALFPIALALAASAAAVEIQEKEHAISAEVDGRTLWTFNHDPAEAKPCFHPLASTDGTVFTDLRPEDHPWHRGVWFSWKFINSVNYWEEDRETGKVAGATRIVSVERKVAKNQTVRLALKLEYAPAESVDPVMKEERNIWITPPDETGAYFIDWSSTFTAIKDVTLDRTPIPGEPGGKPWGGYAGWSVRMNAAMKGGEFLNSEGQNGAAALRESARWVSFAAPGGGLLLLMDHPDNLRHPATWYIAEGMPYFSPAVIHDAPLTIKAGQTLALKYRLVILPKSASIKDAEAQWKNWLKNRVVILTGSNKHDWKATTPALKSILESTGTFNVDVVEDPEKLTAEFLGSHDVLLSNWNGFGKNKPGPWSVKLKKAYVDFVRKGGGHVVVHAGSSSFYDWDDYQAICLATWKDGTGHKQPHEFEVRVTKPDHTVVQGLENFKTFDELWFKPYVHPEATVIAESFSQHTGNWEPTALIGQFGTGRCFTLLLGHDNNMMQNEGFKTLLTSGTEWAAERR